MAIKRFILLLLLSLGTITAQIPDSAQTLDTLLVKKQSELSINTSKDLLQANSKLDRDQVFNSLGAMLDPIRALHNQGEYQATNDLSVLPQFRSGAWYENSVDWNGIPIIRPFHWLNIFSIFSMEGSESTELDLNQIPLDQSSVIGGHIRITPRTHLDSIQIAAGIDMMRQDIYIGIPFQWQSIHWQWTFSSQIVWYNYFLDGMGKVISAIGDDSTAQKVPEFLKLVELPFARDFQTGLQGTWRDWNFSYQWIGSWDDLVLRDLWSQNDTNILSPSQIDTLVTDQSSYIIQQIQIQHPLNSQWDLCASSDWQALHQKPQNDQDEIYQVDQEHFHANLNLQNHTAFNTLQLGLDGNIDHLASQIGSNMTINTFELLSRGTMNYSSETGMLNPHGASFASLDTSGISGMEYGLSQNIFLNEESQIDQRNWALFISDQLRMDSWTFLIGLRSQWWTLSERGLNWDLDPLFVIDYTIKSQSKFELSNQITSQDQYPFGIREFAQANFKAARNWNGNLGWQQVYNSIFSTKANIWARFGWDLPEFNLDTLNSNITNDQLPSILQSVYGIRYDNSARQWSDGLSLELDYQILNLAKGSFHGELTQADRWNSHGLDYVPDNFRPWSLIWQNTFYINAFNQFSSQWSYAAGQAYTSFRSSYQSDEQLHYYFGALNQGRLGNYSRIDLRWSHFSHLGPLLSESYFEIWNAWNTPNNFLNDAHDHELKYFDLNIPFPFIFWGYRIHF